MKEEQSCGDKRPSRLQCGLVRPYLPGLLSRMVTGEDTHGDHSCQMLFPWCRRMIVFMDPDGALWQRGGKTLPHLGEDTVAGCEMKLNKVTPTVIARPVTHLPPSSPHPWPGPVLCMKNIAFVFILCLITDLALQLPRCEVMVKEGEERHANPNSMNMFVRQWIRKTGLSHVSPAVWKS